MPVGKDTYGFSALPTGAGYGGGRNFTNAGDNAHFWSATQGNNYKAYNRGLYYADEDFSNYTYEKYASFSVRCLKD